MKPLVLDASAIINGIPTNLIESRMITAPAIIDEIGKREAKLDLEKIEQRRGKPEFLQQIEPHITETKDTLSEPDKELLALALEFNGTLATDDYGIQNIAKKLGIEFIAIGERGIKAVFHWQYYCPGCYKKYDQTGTCEICGTKLKRKPKKN